MIKQMNNIRKSDIRNALIDFCDRFGGQNRAAAILDGVSAATISQVINDKHDLISDDMWRKIASQIGMQDEQWTTVPTANYRDMHFILDDAQTAKLWMAVTGAAGSGKTYACRKYTAGHAEVFYISCDPDWTKRDFFAMLLRKMGIRPEGMTLIQMKQRVVLQMRTKQQPLIILDEADKLSDVVLNSFITLYNDLQYDCAVVMVATEFLAKRFDAGVRYNKKGFNELWSRVGRRCVPLRGVSQNDVAEICRQNGIDDMRTINAIIGDCEGDLRRVERRVHAELKRQRSKEQGATTMNKE